MIALVSLLVIITVSIVVVRIGAVALTMTGVSRDLAVFQAQSAFSGVGFTTRESESVVRHPTRRRIIRLLMLMGNAGITSSVASLVLTFYRGTGREIAYRLVFVAVGLVLLWFIGTSKLVDRALTKIIKAALARWTQLDVTDYARLLEIGRGYSVSEIDVEPDDWLCNHNLRQLALTGEGILVLGVHKSTGRHIGAPDGETMIEAQDILTCYGPEKILRELASRAPGREGDQQHLAAVEAHRQERQQQAEA
jgi:hypothetical protein